MEYILRVSEGTIELCSELLKIKKGFKIKNIFFFFNKNAFLL